MKLSARIILGIESSCDDTAAAIVSYEDGNSKILSSVVVNQNTLHEKYGGVVPEIAARAHAERIDTVVKNTFTEAEFEIFAEKKDACYHKVKARYKVWPSAYASGALVQCRKKGAANWGNKSKK